MGCNLSINATHLIGGEIYYEQIGTNNYLITLKVYRDCGPDNVNNTQFDDEAHIGIFNSMGLVEVLDLSFFDAEINVVPITSENPCFILPPDLCIEEAIYTGTVNLLPNSLGYDIVYQRCCRNNSIINIVNADNSGMSIYTHIPGTAITNDDNSSPIFNNFPPVALCWNADFFFDHSATDADGDSLVYEFYTPFLGGGPDGAAPPESPLNPQPNPPQPPVYDEVVWEAGFSVDYQIAASTDFEIDSETGYLTGVANELGKYAIGVAVHEYRNGVYLNTTYRDFQYLVTICDPNIISAVPEQEQVCDGLTFTFSNASDNATSFFWDFGEEDLETDTSSLENPTWTFSGIGEYEVMLIANPDWSCADTSYAIYEAYPLLEPGIINSDYECLDETSYFDFNAEGNYEGAADFEWDFGSMANPQFSDAENVANVVFDNPGEHTISLIISDFGCTDTTEITFEVPENPVAIIEDQELFCNGFTFEFENLSENAESYSWDFGDLTTVTDWSFDFEPSYTYPDSGVYWVTLTASAPFTCDHFDTGEFTIHTLLDPEFDEQAPQCFEGNSFDFEAFGTVDSETVYDWDFTPLGNPQSSNEPNVYGVSFSDVGIFEVTLTMSENGCVKSYSDEVEVVANPTVGFFQHLSTGCPPLGVLFVDSSWAETPIYYDWDFGDGSSSTQPNPMHIYTEPGTYDVTLNIETLFGCVDQLSMTVENAVSVFPEPDAGFLIEPPIVDILSPVFEVTDESEGSTGCYYFIDEHGLVETCDFEYELSQAGRFDILQVVTNDYGCSDSVSHVITVEGFLFYVPNSFSPNGDGINDEFFTSGTGISKYDITIYDRWGTIIHRGTDMNEPWLGEVRGGNHYAEAGVYNYQIVVHDLLNRPHEFVGHITIIR